VVKDINLQRRCRVIALCASEVPSSGRAYRRLRLGHPSQLAERLLRVRTKRILQLPLKLRAIGGLSWQNWGLW
jgi:hypothetical protein